VYRPYTDARRRKRLTNALPTWQRRAISRSFHVRHSSSATSNSAALRLSPLVRGIPWAVSTAPFLPHRKKEAADRYAIEAMCGYNQLKQSLGRVTSALGAGRLCNAFASRPSAGPSPPIGGKASMLDAIAQLPRICYSPTFPPKQRQLARTSSDREIRCKAAPGRIDRLAAGIVAGSAGG
jgi:hypothetical protein